MFCYLLVQVLIVEFQQEPGTVEIEFTAVTSSPGQAAVCRVRVEVYNQIKSYVTSGFDDTQPSIQSEMVLYIVKYLDDFQVRDIQPPLVTGCPHSKTVFLEPGEVKLKLHFV